MGVSGYYGSNSPLHLHLTAKTKAATMKASSKWKDREHSIKYGSSIPSGSLNRLGQSLLSRKN